MHPNQVARPILVRNGAAKYTICFDVRLPSLRIEFHFSREVVEYGPQRLVGKALIKALGNIWRQIDRDAVFGAFPILKNGLTSFIFRSYALARPADPNATRPVDERSHRA